MTDIGEFTVGKQPSKPFSYRRKKEYKSPGQFYRNFCKTARTESDILMNQEIRENTVNTFRPNFQILNRQLHFEFLRLVIYKICSTSTTKELTDLQTLLHGILEDNAITAEYEILEKEPVAAEAAAAEAEAPKKRKRRLDEKDTLHIDRKLYSLLTLPKLISIFNNKDRYATEHIITITNTQVYALIDKILKEDEETLLNSDSSCEEMKNAYNPSNVAGIQRRNASSTRQELCEQIERDVQLTQSQLPRPQPKNFTCKKPKLGGEKTKRKNKRKTKKNALVRKSKRSQGSKKRKRTRRNRYKKLR